jgi:hypothetical protein
MPKQKKDTDPSARIPTPSIDLDEPSSEDASSERASSPNRRTAEPSGERTNEPSSQRSDERSNQRTAEPENQRSDELGNQRSDEPENQRVAEPANRGTTETQGKASSRGGGAASRDDGFADAPLTYESMITPTAPINRKKIGVHIDEVTFDASSEAWREMLRIDNNLNKGVVVEAALRVALADFAEKGSESSLWKMVEQICRTES